MSYYVKRHNPETNREGYTGPIRTARQAGKEAEAWIHAGWYPVRILESTPALRSEVRAWQKAAQKRRADAIAGMQFA